MNFYNKQQELEYKKLKKSMKKKYKKNEDGVDQKGNLKGTDQYR